MLGKFFMFLLSSKLTFSKKEKKIRNTIRVSNGLDPDQDRHSDLGKNCLQRLLADDKSRR